MKKCYYVCYYFISSLILVAFVGQAWGQEEPVQAEIVNAQVELEQFNQLGEEIIADEISPVIQWHGREEAKALQIETQERIQKVVAEITNLTDRNDEAELQKKIGQIKSDYEIARLRLVLKKAEKDGDEGLIAMLTDEIDHLENIDAPVIGSENEQGVPQYLRAGN